MKKTTISFVIFISAIILASILLLSFNNQQNETQERFYYAFDKKIIINEIPNKILVEKQPEISNTNFKILAKQFFGEIETEKITPNLFELRLKNTKRSKEKIQRILLDRKILSARPVYKTKDGNEMGFTNELVVQYKSYVKESEKASLLTSNNLKKIRSTKIYDLFEVRKNEDVLEIANRLYETGLFEFAYPNIMSKAEFHSIYPNDPYFNRQFSLHNTGHYYSNGRYSTNDADIDAPKCKIMPIRLNLGNSEADAAAIVFAVDNGAHVISNSWGYPPNQNQPVINAAIQYAIDNNVVVIFSAGNNARHKCNNNGMVGFPPDANITGLITVGASDRFDSLANYSPVSQHIDIVAPSHKSYPGSELFPCSLNGETYEIWTIDIPDEPGCNPWKDTFINPPPVGDRKPNSGTNHLAYTGYFGGTSAACPLVAGTAALILSKNPSLNPYEVYDILTSSADKLPYFSYVDGRCDDTGYGRVNAFKALQASCTTRDYVGYTLTEDKSVRGCIINVQNVTVSNSSKLNIEATESISINADFEVQANSELEISVF
ncbi:MAG: S8 family peptidase [Bacteroidota bacterium]